jgi:hypothetical protein
MPTNSNTVSGLTVHPTTGKIYEVSSVNGTCSLKTYAKKAAAATTVVTGLTGTAYNASYSSSDECLNLTAVSPTTKQIYEAVEE